MAAHEQKEFYRKLDALLSKIEVERTGSRTDLLATVMNDLVESFGADLSIRNGRLYELMGSDLVLRRDMRGPARGLVGTRIPLSYPPMQLLYQHRCYIFDASTPGLDIDLERKILGGTSSVSIVVGRDQEYVLAFGLADGWQREAIEFALNAIRNALTHRLEHEGLAADLEETRMIQRSLFPKRFPEFAGYELAARVETFDLVGGDFYDFISIEEEALGIATGDASGHGLPAALLVRDVVTGLRMGVEKDMKVTPTIRKLNQVIHRSTMSTKFVSLFYGELELNGNLMYVNAGHIAPFLVLERGIFRLEVGGSVLGPLPDARFKRGFAHLDRGGVLVAISDGIVERANARGDQFDDSGVAESLAGSLKKSAGAIVEDLFAAAKSFGNGRWEDDATVVVVRRLP